MSQTTVVDVHGLSQEDLDRQGVVYVGRPMPEDARPAIRQGSPFGSPFKPGRDGTRAECVERYCAHVLASPDLLALLPGLRGRVLGCWCLKGDGHTPHPMRCHAQVLALLADQPDLIPLG
jgi:hypothetical protein